MHCPSYEARVTALNKRAAANRANAQLSTGPKTPAGKAAVALNNLRHGLAGAFLILPTENEEDFAALLESLLDEHQPATETERLLVTNMARHQWLSDRAIKLQRLVFGDHGVCENGDRLLLYLRYQTTHQRAFHKCLNDLLKLRAERRKTEIGFERQSHATAVETRQHEIHHARLAQFHARLKQTEIRTSLLLAPRHPPISPKPHGFEPQSPRITHNSPHSASPETRERAA